VNKWYKFVPLTFPLLLLLAACGSIINRQNLDVRTLTPMSQALRETITARAIEAGSGSEQATAFAKATALSNESTAQAATDIADYQGTATAIIPVLEELRRYGVDPLGGNVAWLQGPLTIDINGYQQYGYANDYPEITAADFVLAADVTWNTQAASAGCGFVFRSDGNKDKPNQFMVSLARYAYGTSSFSALVDGNLADTQVFYPKTKDKTFNGDNDSTNRLVIVVRGTLIDIYTNGVMIGEVDTTKPPPTSIDAPIFPVRPVNPTAEQLLAYQQAVAQYNDLIEQNRANLSEAQRNYNSAKIATFIDGFVSFVGVSEYGHTVCTFDKTWLFLIGKPPTPTPNLTWTRTPTLTPTPTRTYDRRGPTWTPTLPKDTPIPTSTPTLSSGDFSLTATQNCINFQNQFPGTPCP
jgi:hypothetical protein